MKKKILMRISKDERQNPSSNGLEKEGVGYGKKREWKIPIDVWDKQS